MPSASASASAARMPSASASAARMPSASTSAALALYDSPAPPSTQFIAPFSTRAMTKLAGYGALGPLAATCIGSAALVAGAVSTAALVAGAVSTAFVAGEKPVSRHASSAVQEVLEGQMLFCPLATVCFQSGSSSGVVINIISEQLLAEEMLPGAVGSPGLESSSSSPLTSNGGWGMKFAGASPSGQHLLGAPHRSYLFAARGGGVPRRGYTTATGGVIEENVKLAEKIEDLGQRLHIVEKVQEVMLRRRRNGRLALIGIAGVGATLCNVYGADLFKKGDQSITDFMGPRLKGALLDEVTWSNFSAAMNHLSYGLLGYSKEQQAINAKHLEDMKRAKEEHARKLEQERLDWYRKRKEREVRFNQNRPADEHPLARCIAWMQCCMDDEELAAKRAEWLKYQRLDAIRARAIRRHEKEEDGEKKREEEDAESRKDQSLADIRARAIRNWEKKEEEKKKREEEKKKREKKVHRIGAAAPSRTPCPNRISVFEKAVSCCGENPAGNVITPVLGTTFESLGEAYNLCVHVGGYHPESTVKQIP